MSSDRRKNGTMSIVEVEPKIAKNRVGAKALTRFFAV